ncbi:MAG: hypothetical protein V1850_03015 [Candidatus Bathyarchaeota archaeon]
MRKMLCDKRDAEHLKAIELDDNVSQGSLNDEYVKYFIKCLELERKTGYKFKSRPDLHNRQSAQPDYLFVEPDTGKLIAIEYTRIFESEERTKSTAFTMDEHIKHNTAPGLLGTPPWSINPPTPRELGGRLTEFFIRKLSKGQFNSFAHAERILLCRNMWTDARIKHFSEAQPFIKIDALKNLCDHIYVVEHVHLDIIKIF